MNIPEFLHMDKEEWVSPKLYTGLCSAILPYPYAEIKDNHTVWAQPFFIGRMGEPKTV
jgi:hypothetical protein